jgi:hypothetical protein
MGVDAGWGAFSAAAGHPGGYYEATAFGDGPALRDELCELVLRGIKRATPRAAFWGRPGADAKAWGFFDHAGWPGSAARRVRDHDGF